MLSWGCRFELQYLEPAEVVFVVTGMKMCTSIDTGMGAGLLPVRQAPKDLHTSKRPAPIPLSLPLPIHLPVTTGTASAGSKYFRFKFRVVPCNQSA